MTRILLDLVADDSPSNDDKGGNCKLPARSDLVSFHSCSLVEEKAKAVLIM